MTATLKRKLAGEHRDGATSNMTALRALRLSLARAGEDLLGLALAASGGQQARVSPEELGSVFSDRDLLVVLDCPGGATGAAAISFPLVSALIQQQTAGRVFDRPAEERSYTDTDAALVAPLLEGVLSRVCDLAEEHDDQECFQSIRFGARAEDARSLLLALRAQRYRTFQLPIDVAQGRHQARVIFALPASSEREETAAHEETNRADRASKSPFLTVETELRAVLARVRLPISEINALAKGDVLPLSRERLDDTALVTVNDRVVARGKLGQMNGHRAVRLAAPSSVPKAGQSTSFEPQATAQPQQDRNDLPTPESVAQLGNLASDASASDLATLSTEDVVEQISTLAGLTVDDLAAVDPTVRHDLEGDAQSPALYLTDDRDMI